MGKLHYFRTSFILTALGLAAGAAAGFAYGGTLTAALQSLLIVAILSVLEVSLSFDNAVVNAAVLKEMDIVWRRRFITWGIMIAVFGMRLFLPLFIVAIVAHLGPWEAIRLAFTEPQRYEQIMHSVHVQISAFGGTFLLMVGLTYFINTKKEVHWISIFEQPMAKLAHVEAFAIGTAVLVLVAISEFLSPEVSKVFLKSGLYGLLVYVGVEILSHFLSHQGATETGAAVKRSGLASFLYLEVLDASFSFDGVVGALAISNNLIIIMLGLGIGAMFVRSLTILLVEEETLEHFIFLEHGAFYAIIALALMMFLDVLCPVPELITGLIGATFIGVSIWSSIKYTRARTLAGHRD